MLSHAWSRDASLLGAISLRASHFSFAVLTCVTLRFLQIIKRKCGQIIILAASLVAPSMAAWCNYGTFNQPPEAKTVASTTTSTAYDFTLPLERVLDVVESTLTIARFGAGTVPPLRRPMVVVLVL
ncbi:hypothetical protein BDP81DRAFT_454628 [Colletotrichum phormii]|uniref:Uncharacterized protein n=1 Tax=Colletotrichum phormii TaxID=359342 RepID=A0AAJ0EB03_9PEZI|nr:uncharacterized protein BDP81DRAFT_454628 [Colletotrichum phormii]KAK1623223.1 hypothetical protein BDP81DRAFT_454628 [Colletotrichum phormii]